MVRDSGFPAMFVNRTAVAITLQGGGCGERQALYERWTGSGWQTISGLPNPCGVPASPVGAGDSTLTGGGAQLLVPGSYRLRLGTTGGAAISPVVVLR